MTAVDSGTRNGLRMTASFEANIEAPLVEDRLIMIKMRCSTLAAQINR